MITWLLTANNDHDLLDAGSADTRRVAAEDVVNAALSHFATHADLEKHSTPVTVVVGDDEIICGPGYTDDGAYDEPNTTKGMYDVRDRLSGRQLWWL
jgi:hypothetical protein